MHLSHLAQLGQVTALYADQLLLYFLKLLGSFGVFLYFYGRLSLCQVARYDGFIQLHSGCVYLSHHIQQRLHSCRPRLGFLNTWRKCTKTKRTQSRSQRHITSAHSTTACRDQLLHGALGIGHLLLNLIKVCCGHRPKAFHSFLSHTQRSSYIALSYAA